MVAFILLYFLPRTAVLMRLVLFIPCKLFRLWPVQVTSGLKEQQLSILRFMIKRDAIRVLVSPFAVIIDYLEVDK